MLTKLTVCNQSSRNQSFDLKKCDQIIFLLYFVPHSQAGSAQIILFVIGVLHVISILHKIYATKEKTKMRSSDQGRCLHFSPSVKFSPLSVRGSALAPTPQRCPAKKPVCLTPPNFDYLRRLWKMAWASRLSSDACLGIKQKRALRFDINLKYLKLSSG